MSSDDLETLLSSPDVAPFLSESFHVATFTSTALKAGSSAVETVDRVAAQIKRIDQAISAEVAENQPILISNVKRSHVAEGQLQDVVLGVETLSAAVQRIRGEIVGPYETVQARTRQLRNLHGTIETLRAVILRLKLVQKLRQQLAPSTSPASLDLAKAAKLLTDIRTLDVEAESEGLPLKGVEAVEADDPFLLQASLLVRKQADESLVEGMESMSQAKVGSALQVFFNLEELKPAVASLVTKHLGDLERAVKGALDPRQLGASGGSLGVRPLNPLSAVAGSVGDATGGPWLDKLWLGLKEVMEVLNSSVASVWHLQRVVAKKRDPLTHVCFLDVLVLNDPPSSSSSSSPPGLNGKAGAHPDDTFLTRSFWSDAMKCLSEAFASVSKPGAKGGGAVRDVLMSPNGFLKLIQLLEASFDKLLAETTIKGSMPAVLPGQIQDLVACALPLETLFRSSCLSRLSEVISFSFQGGSRALPSPADVQKCIGRMHEELKVASPSPQVAAMVAAEVASALNLLASKADTMMVSGPEVRSVLPPSSSLMTSSHGGAATGVSPPNPSQLRNITICSQLQEIHRSLTGLLPRLPTSASATLKAALTVLQGTAVGTVSSIFKAFMEILEEKVLAIHDLIPNADPTQPDSSATPSSSEGTGDASSSSPPAPPPPPMAAHVMDTSPYIQECTLLLTGFRQEYLSRFVPVPSPNVPSCAASLVERMAARLLMFFVRHASLVRPLGPLGKLQVAKDLAELQLSVGQNLWPLEQLPMPFRALKAFRALLFQEASGVLTGPLVRDLPPSIVLHHLFSRLPATLRAPHERSGLKPGQYSTWLDQHSAEETISGIAGALEADEEVISRLGAQDKQVVEVMKEICTR